MITRPTLVRGKRLRDEFACPITRELMRDPVIAADGNTYDREAIEMWLKNHDTSPKRNERMEHLNVVTNLNLKRLIADLISEGGEGLYYKEENFDASGPFQHALVPEQVLILKCLGPVESSWNGKSFRVSQRGCVGGRKAPTNSPGDFMHFTDTTVSRKHFEIIFDSSEKEFKIKDFGSAGGTFLRLPFKAPRPLYPGLMIMIGKHQLKVDLPGGSSPERAKSIAKDEELGSGPLAATLHQDGGSSDAKDSRPATPTLPHSAQMGYNVRLQALVSQLADGDQLGATARGLDKADGSRTGEINVMMDVDANQEGCDGSDDDSVKDMPGDCTEDAKDLSDGEEKAAMAKQHSRRAFKAEAKLASGFNTLLLSCFAPEGTPIQGRQYLVDREGAKLGRKPSNKIVFSHEVDGQVMSIDSSISGEHSRIEYNEDENCLQLLDGTPEKASTNGTWCRLSGMHTESKPFLLLGGSEVLIGTVRFNVIREVMIVEKEISSQDEEQAYIKMRDGS